jgi:DNA-binding MarR family transcriptional regulator/N-acetylglutamate synthase-like GNAT family acetyltransferase
VPAARELEQRTEAFRHFNRFITKKIGVLQKRFLGSPYSLAEGRVLYELARRDRSTATQVRAELGLDAGYLSRILHNFEKHGLISRETSAADARRSHLWLTPKGRKALAPLNGRARVQISTLLKELNDEDQARLIGAMRLIQKLLGAPMEKSPTIVIRNHQIGDMGWVVQRQGVVYGQEYGWDEQFEALCAEIVARFLRQFDAKRERCWVAEMDGEKVGCVFLVKKSEKVSQLRLLLVESAARGYGIGGRLVDECIRFARQVGYRKMILWTNDILHAARHLYEQRGFRLIDQEKHHSFGHDLVGQTWELRL